MKRALLTLILCSLFAACLPVPPIAQAQQERPEPHLGYGLHLDPNVPVDPAIVDQMGMDWVKLYADGQIGQFQHKRILFRLDMRWTDDFEGLRRMVEGRTRTLSSLGVDAIEVHNEPNLSTEWEPRLPNAWEYTQVLRVAYQAIKSVDPNMIVVSAGLAPTITTPDRRAITDIDFAREMLENGAGRYFDAFGYHPYGYNAPPENPPDYNVLNFRRAELMWDLLQEFGITGKQIWMTEFGWVRDPAEDGIFCRDDDPDFQGFAWMRVSGQAQADYIVRAFRYADDNWPWAGPMFLWNLNFSQRADDISLSPCNHQRWFGLTRRDGSPLPALHSVAAMPKRYSRYLPSMALVADDMTLEISRICEGEHQVGQIEVANSGYPGSFSATVQAAQPPLGPALRLSAESVRSGQTIDVYANIEGVSPGLHIVYINVRATIGGRLHAQHVRGFVIVQEQAVNNC